MSGAAWQRLLRWSLVAALLVASLDALVPSVHASRLACGVCEAIVDEVRQRGKRVQRQRCRGRMESEPAH